MQAAPARPRRSVSPWAEAWRRFKRHRLAVLGLVVLALMVLLVAFGPFVWREDDEAEDGKPVPLETAPRLGPQRDAAPRPHRRRLDARLS